MVAAHSIEYRNLLSLFLVHSVWHENTCLNDYNAGLIMEYLGLSSVPLLYGGIYKTSIAKDIAKRLNPQTQEGIVVRVNEIFRLDQFQTHAAKYVRAGHVPDDSKHWTHTPITYNSIKERDTERNDTRYRRTQ